MPVGTLPALLALAIVATFAGAYYLLLNARSVAALFNRPGNELAPGRGRAPPPRGRLVAAIVLFVCGTVASLLLWSFAATDEAIDAVESHPAEVQRR